MIRLSLLMSLVTVGSAFAQKLPIPVQPPPPVLPDPPESRVVSVGQYNVAAFIKRDKRYDTAEKVARALNDALDLGYDARKKSDRRLVVLSGQELEVRATGKVHEQVRRFLELGHLAPP